MAISSPFFAEVYVRRFLMPAAREYGIVVTPEMERTAIERLKAGPKDEDNPDVARPGEWELN